MKTYIVHLDSVDDVVSIRDKISWSKAQRVLLVWPRRGRVLERQVDLLLLQRYSQQLGFQLALVTRRSTVLQHAELLGLPTFRHSRKAQQVPWRRPNPRRRSFRPDAHGPPVADDLRLRRAQFAARPLPNVWLRLTAFLVGVIAFAALALFFMPGADVRLTPARQEQSLSIAAWASPQVLQASPSGGMPAYVVRVVVEGRDTAQSSAIALAADQTAVGEVQITNLTDQPVRVPTGTTLLTLPPTVVRFVTTRTVDLPAGPEQAMNVPIRAESPGNQGNVSAGEISAVEGLIGLRITVVNSEDTRGGSQRRSPAPSVQDYRVLREKLMGALRLNALAEMQARLQPDQSLLASSLRVVDTPVEEREPEIGQPSDRLQITLRVTYEAWYVEERDLQVVAQAALDANLPPGFRPLPGSLRTEFLTDPIIDEVGTVRWPLSASRSLQAEWSQAQAVQAIRGKTLQEASQILETNFSLAEPAHIQLFPQWWFRLPILSFRIAVLQ